MVTSLYLLGGARLEGADGRIKGEPAQRHRLALLALLALDRNHRLPREKLMALLWPEHSPPSARHLLNVSLHVLRKALGSSALSTEGDDIHLDTSNLSCDVLQFRNAVERDDFREATDLYTGPFLDGFFLDNARDFERWQEEVRSRLAAAFADALEARAEAAERDRDRAEALNCWQSLIAHRPENARATLRLMRFLEAAGDRAGVLKTAEAHARILQEVFGAKPDPAIAEFAERVRTEPTAAQKDEGPDVPESQEFASVPVSPVPDNHAPAAVPAPTEVPASAAVPPPAHSGARLSGAPHLRPWSWLLLGVAVGAAGITAIALRSDVGDPAPASVAVLPFEILNPTANRAYLSDGLAEDLLTDLARLPWLRVAARSSAFQLHERGANVRTIGRRLNVAAVVRGSIRIEDDRLRVTARLIDAQNGYLLWSEQYDRRMRDVLAVQEEIARAVASALGAELARQIPDTFFAAATSNASAYQLYLRGRHEWRKRTEEGMWAALQAFQDAIELDPGYAAAYAGLADAWQLLPDYGGVPTREGMARAKTAALRAIALDSTLAAAHAALGAVFDDYDHDWAGAEHAYRRAIELNPGYATAHHWLALHLANQGRFPEALAEIERARRLDPLSLIINTAAGAIRYFARDWNGAIAEYQSVLDQEPGFAIAWALLGRVQLLAGQVDDAVESLRRSVELSDGDPSYEAVYAAALAAAERDSEARAIADRILATPRGGYLPYCELASAYLYLGDDEQALALFERGLRQRDPALKHINVEPLYDTIRENPRFQDLLRRAGFPVVS